MVDKKVNCKIEENSSEDQHKKEKCDELGGPKGEEPTRYGDWEIKGKCVDF